VILSILLVNLDVVHVAAVRMPPILVAIPTTLRSLLSKWKK